MFSNSASPYGTFDQGGNVSEWYDGAFGDIRTRRGGNWNVGFPDGADYLRSDRFGGSFPNAEDSETGFRVALVPEPSTYALLALAAAGFGAHVVRRRRK